MFFTRFAFLLLSFFLTAAAPAWSASLDCSYGGNGIAFTNISPNSDILGDARLDDQGRILLSGHSNLESMVLVRLLPSGAPDPSFGNNGRVVTPIGPNTEGTSLAIDSVGRIVVSITQGSFNANDYEAIVARFLTDGSLDTTFGDEGISRIVYSDDAGGSTVRRVIVDSQDRPVLVGSFRREITGRPSRLAVARLTTSGALDWRLTSLLAGSQQSGNDLIVLSDGKLMALATVSTGSTFTPRSPGLVGINANGTIDTSFSGNGISVAAPVTGADSIGRSVVADGSGGYIIGMSSTIGGSNNIAMARFNGNGSLDTAWGDNGNGAIMVNLAQDHPNRLILDDHGRPLITGSTTFQAPGAFHTFVLRALADGSALDDSFNGSGLMLHSYGGNQRGETVLMQPDGRMLLGGYSTAGGPGSWKLATARYVFNDQNQASIAIDDISPSPGTVLEPVTVDFTVSASDATPQGQVWVSDGANATCSATLIDGQGSCQVIPQSKGTRTWTAQYQGSSDHCSASATDSQTIAGLPATLEIVGTTPGSSVSGQEVSFMFNVSAAVPAEGTVTLSADSGESCNAPASDGECSMTFASAGPRQISGVFDGDMFEPASTEVPYNVSPAATAITSIETSAPPVAGEQALITFELVVAAPGSGTPDGAVMISESAGGSCATTVAEGGCELTWHGPGMQEVTVSYQGSNDFQSTSAQIPISVAPFPVAVELATAPSPSLQGQQITVEFDLTASPLAPPLSGTVFVRDEQDNLLCSGTVEDGSCITSITDAGPATLIAQFPTDEVTFASSQSAPFIHQVQQTANLQLSISAPPSMAAGMPMLVDFEILSDQPGTATSPVLDIDFPEGVMVFGIPNCPDGLPCTLPEMAPGGSLLLMVPIGIEPDYLLDELPNPLIISAEVSSELPGLFPADRVDSHSIEIVAVADLGVTLDVPEFIPEGDQFETTMTVTSMGPSATEPVAVVLIPGDGIDQVQWTCNSSLNGDCGSGSGPPDEMLSLFPTEEVVFTIQARLANAGSDELATLSALVEPGPELIDPDMDNNTATVVVQSGIFADGFE